MYQFGGQCFKTKTQANTARASAESGKVLEHAGQAHLVTVTAVDETAVTYTLQPLSGGVPTIIQAPQQPLDCQLLTAEDGALIGSSIAAGWLVIYGILSLLNARVENDA
ncbi:hypothetical protein ACFO3A_04180 [Comamonas nitrativorans]|uniref:Uncharacterized protein n=1 Tax=Comamonas nitrativorans TaxID=108437 RepID=A0ABV9GTN8_9BURK